MTDIISSDKRSWNMSRIRSRDTAPERAVRSVLHNMGFRFRLHMAKLPGKPDIVLAKHKTVIFVHGCFWHRHPGCKYSYNPKSRVEFWQAKFRQNVERHNKVCSELKTLGWKVIIIWECETSNLERLTTRVRELMQVA